MGQRSFLFYLLIFLYQSWLSSSSSEYSVTGEVSGGNYSYYRLTSDGHILMTLTSLSGDADIYISESSMHPTFDVHQNDLQSVTCGEDVIEISSDMKRPVGIGVYGHPTYEISSYHLHMRTLEDHPDPYKSMAYEYEKNSQSFDPYTPRMPDTSSIKAKKPVEEESLLWSLFIGLLKILLEVLT